MKGIVFLAVALASLPAVAAQQTELGGKVRSGREVTIAAGETVQGDLIASAGTVRIDGRVDGDLVASGGQVIVAGTVTGDVLAGAGSTTISGEVGGDLRAGTGQARIEGRVGEDVLLGVGQATVASEAQIGGDLIFGAGRMQLDGAVAGSVLGSTGNYTRGGSVGGSERVNVGQPEEEQEPTLADRTVDALRRYVSILVIGVLLLWLLPRAGGGAGRGDPGGGRLAGGTPGAAGAGCAAGDGASRPPPARRAVGLSLADRAPLCRAEMQRVRADAATISRACGRPGACPGRPPAIGRSPQYALCEPLAVGGQSPQNTGLVRRLWPRYRPTDAIPRVQELGPERTGAFDGSGEHHLQLWHDLG